MGPIWIAHFPPINTPNYEHGSYDDDDDIEEEAPTGDTDVTVT